MVMKIGVSQRFGSETDLQRFIARRSEATDRIKRALEYRTAPEIARVMTSYIDIAELERALPTITMEPDAMLTVAPLVREDDRRDECVLQIAAALGNYPRSTLIGVLAAWFDLLELEMHEGSICALIEKK